MMQVGRCSGAGHPRRDEPLETGVFKTYPQRSKAAINHAAKRTHTGKGDYGHTDCQVHEEECHIQGQESEQIQVHSLIPGPPHGD